MLDALERLEFTNSFIRAMREDPSRERSSRAVEKADYSLVDPEPVPDPRIVAVSKDVARTLGLPMDGWSDPEAAKIFAGNRVASGMKPFASRYGGHQFGAWADQLGDGRAITLGEVTTPGGERFELQLKGAGRTPYSRHADGRAVLRSSLREFVCSEAMHHLRVPTTRALTLALTGEDIVRDILYDGHPRPEPGAVVCRVAPTFVRFGHFEILAARGDSEGLARLADYVLETYFPELGARSPESMAAWLREIGERTAELMAHWIRLGFVHGVMNTDNMSVLGLTIDYGPFGWLDDYDPDFTPNTTDHPNGRYRYRNQPHIALWNLERLAVAVADLIDDEKLIVESLESYASAWKRAHEAAMAAKLGLENLDASRDDSSLVGELFSLLASRPTDMTIFFRRLMRVPIEEEVEASERTEPLASAFYDPEAITEEARERLERWLERYARRVRADRLSPDARTETMRRANPAILPRNYLCQLAIDRAEEGDFTRLEQLLEAIQRPYDDALEDSDLFAKRPDWAKSRPGCSMLSCSS